MTGELKEQLAEVKFNLHDRGSRGEARLRLSELLRSQAWAMLRAHLDREVMRLNEFLVSSSNPNELLKNSGELKTVLAVLRWPVSTIAMIDAREEQERRTNEAKKEREHGR